MNHKDISLIIFLPNLFLFCTTFADTENINPGDDGSQHAYGENIGWLNLRTACIVDLMIFTAFWLDYCPHGWRLGLTGYKVKTS